MRVDVNINGLTGEDVDRAVKKAVFATAERALRDCNFYCKQDYTGLIFSSVIHTTLENSVRVDWDKMPEQEQLWALSSEGSDLEAGILRWCMPYAEEQYSNPTAYPDKNPNATKEWCSVAENNHKREWDMTFVSALHREGL